METFAEKYWKKWGLQEHPIAKKPVERVYIGNTFCPHLFPENDILHAMLEKAKIEGNFKLTLTFSLDQRESDRFNQRIAEISGTEKRIYAE